MRFFEDESCGQCTPCRVGTAKAVKLMEEATWDKPLLEELARAMEDAAICGLGQAAPNPLRCAIKYFPAEFIDMAANPKSISPSETVRFTLNGQELEQIEPGPFPDHE